MNAFNLRAVIWLAGWVGLCFVAAGIGSAFTAPAIGGWYATLHRPSWSPPNWVFGPVWSVLYLLMGIAAWLVWRRRGVRRVRLPIALFLLQLGLNVAWSIIFFGMHAIGAAMIEIVLLWAAILATVVVFWNYSRTAALLMAPYLLWVTYAATLNFGFWRLN